MVSVYSTEINIHFPLCGVVHNLNRGEGESRKCFCMERLCIAALYQFSSPNLGYCDRENCAVGLVLFTTKHS